MPMEATSRTTDFECALAAYFVVFKLLAEAKTVETIHQNKAALPSFQPAFIYAFHKVGSLVSLPCFLLLSILVLVLIQNLEARVEQISSQECRRALR